MQVGDTLTLRIGIADKKVGDKVVIREIFKRESSYNFQFDIFREAEIRGIKLVDIYGLWFLHCFEETHK